MAAPGRTSRVHSLSFLLFGALAGAALAGCAWVGPGAVEEKLDSLDHDGDGAPFGGPPGVRDCDDFDPDVAPGLPEIPYDGLDNDCGGDGDLIDLDGDGYAGISRTAYLALFPDATWPSHLPPDLVDCVDDPADHPKARDIHPKASDAPYDGIDANCQGDDDFDADGDGFLPERFELGGELFETAPAREAYAEAWGLDLGEPVFGDCDDLDAGVNPSVPAEDDVPYDGRDSDCDGRNDFDQDGDGWMPDAPGYAQRYEQYVARTHRGEPPWGEARWGDCLDAPDPARFDGDPALVHPEAEDAPYDGVDADCDGANDFDADGDGAMPDTAPGHPDHDGLVEAFRAYVSAWGGPFPEVWGDCDDEDPLAVPGGLERWGDASDGDCDGHRDTTPLVHAGHAWTEPRRPVLVATPTHYVLTTAATAVDLAAPIGVHHDEVGLSLTFARTAGTGAVPLEHLIWLSQANPGDPRPVHFGVDAVATADGFWAAAAFDGLANRHVQTRRYTWDVGLGAHDLTRSALFNTGAGARTSSLDLVVDGQDHPWVTACEPSRTLVGRGTQNIQSLVSTALPADLCLFDGAPPAVGQPVSVQVCDAGACTSHAYDAAAGTFVPAGSTPWQGSVLDGRSRDGWYQLVGSPTGARVVRADGAVEYPLFGGRAVSSFDADWKDGRLWVAAVVWDAAVQRDVVKVGWADPAVDANHDGEPDLHLVDWPLSNPAVYTPIHVALLADADRLVVAVTEAHASDPAADRVAWAFVGW